MHFALTAVPQKICHHMNYNKFNNSSPNSFPVFVNKKFVINNDQLSNTIVVAYAVHPLVLDENHREVHHQIVRALLVRQLAIS